MAAKDSRSRNWTFVGYPEDSLPTNYREILSDDLHLTWAESPIHDSDYNPDGTKKKTHIHFIVCFEGNKSFEQIKEIADMLGCPMPQKVQSVNGMVRYFIHKDNPEKHQYKKEDIICHGGFDLDAYFAPTGTEYLKMIDEIIDFITVNEFYEFNKLVECVHQMKNMDWLYILTSRNTNFFVHFMKSRKFEKKEEDDNKLRKECRERLVKTDEDTCSL